MLRSRTSVLAAANPPSGRYDDLKSAQVCGVCVWMGGGEEGGHSGGGGCEGGGGAAGGLRLGTWAEACRGHACSGRVRCVMTQRLWPASPLSMRPRRPRLHVLGTPPPSAAGCAHSPPSLSPLPSPLPAPPIPPLAVGEHRPTVHHPLPLRPDLHRQGRAVGGARHAGGAPRLPCRAPGRCSCSCSSSLADWDVDCFECVRAPAPQRGAGRSAACWRAGAGKSVRPVARCLPH